MVKLAAREKVGIPDTFPAQIRAARALLDWSRDTLSSASGVTVRTLDRLEGGEVLPQRRTIEAVVAALEAAGVVFINGDEPGVKLRRNS